MKSTLKYHRIRQHMQITILTCREVMRIRHMQHASNTLGKYYVIIYKLFIIVIYFYDSRYYSDD